ncbi:MAG TPA: tRNA (adenosine(37)-N6)-threonylcarbamoyltransferase complex dimerization subunit type 1 TsaB [Steroidobacteraceae bacterium]|nr:tRNA (adenosine(37)-N6)-threonylcarbamoyltransferase complex dimerization subunit type 1 TsaB [Steroidobacteraceae bacterium]
MRLLALDTASARCSVALLDDDSLVTRAVETARDHAALILPMIDELLAEAGIALRALDGIAFGRGPGSFTGVRVAAAVTQGLAAGADLPVLGVSDLRALAAQARRVAAAAGPGSLLLAAMDARMGEIYWGVFDAEAALPGEALPREAVGAPESLPASLRGRIVAAAGRGLSVYPAVAVSLGIPPGAVLGDAEPHAADIALLAAADLLSGRSWQDAAEAQPVYLRDQVVHVSR